MAMPTMIFSPGPEHRIVVLDGYDISAIGWPRGHPKTLQALEFLGKKNPNSDNLRGGLLCSMELLGESNLNG